MADAFAHASRSGGRLLVEQLVRLGVKHIFCVPGESFLEVLDALLDSPIALTICRQEGGAAMMAEAQGKLTARPGVCFVTRGPGATNASAGIHVAQQDSTPLLLFVGQVARCVRGREAFQELDYRAVFGTMAKWVVEIDDPVRIPELVTRAYHVAASGRPGPVVVALPEDMLLEMSSAVPAMAFAAQLPADNLPGIAPAAGQLHELARLLGEACRPLAILGGSGWTQQAVTCMARFAERFSLPVCCSFRRQMLFDALHPCYAGDIGLGINPKLAERVRDADLVLLIGGRFSEVPSQGYTLLNAPNAPNAPESEQALIHVHADAAELGKLYRPRLAINATPVAFAMALDALAPVRGAPSVAWRNAAHEDYLAWSDPYAIVIPGALQMGAVMAQLGAALPKDAIICNGAGNFSTWVHRFWKFRQYGTQLAPTSGSMGYGVPAAIGAKRLFPERTVVCFAGDGDFMMHGQELATAVQYELPIVIIVLDNGMFGTIRMHQERAYPGRVVGTCLRNPDFVALARAYGAHGERVERTDEFLPALQRTIESGKPGLVHCLLDAEAITPSMTLSGLRAGAPRQ